MVTLAVDDLARDLTGWFVVHALFFLVFLAAFVVCSGLRRVLTSSRAEGRFSVGLICSRRSACTITVGREADPCFGGTGARRLRVLVDGLAYPLDKGGACGAELAAGDDQVRG